MGQTPDDESRESTIDISKRLVAECQESIAKLMQLTAHTRELVARSEQERFAIKQQVTQQESRQPKTQKLLT
jgi:hypothetical protein